MNATETTFLHPASRVARRHLAGRSSAHRQDDAHRTQGGHHPRTAIARRAGPSRSAPWPDRDLVPPLADTLDVVAALTPEELDKCWVWVATPRHVEKAAAAGARRFQYCLSASDSHNKANIGRDTETSLAAMPDAIRIAQEVSGSIQLCFATAFTCPFEGLTDPERVLAIAADPRTEGAEDIVLCDTIGQAVPTQVADLIRALRVITPSAAHRVSRSRHMGSRRGEHPRRHRCGSHHGRRIARRPRRLPVRTGRQRQHRHRGSVVRTAPRLALTTGTGLGSPAFRKGACRDR